MDETIANNAHAKPPVRCDECDTVRDHYVSFVAPTNEVRHVCWNCQERADKAFNTKDGWHRGARQKDIEAAAGE